MPVRPDCPYCNRPAQLVTGDVIYPHRGDLAHLNFWRCKACKAFVGCHRRGVITQDVNGAQVASDGTMPLGSLANRELRDARSRAHGTFDGLWKAGVVTRSEAYVILAEFMELDPAYCHIGMFDLEQCHQVLEAVNDFWKHRRA